MKKYNELTEEQKKTAVEKCLTNLLEAIVEGAIKFNKRLQKKIDHACNKANNMQTPWFYSEYIMETCGDELKEVAQINAEASLYAEAFECVIDGIA